jgi:hypothetical protein
MEPSSGAPFRRIVLGGQGTDPDGKSARYAGTSLADFLIIFLNFLDYLISKAPIFQAMPPLSVRITGKNSVGPLVPHKLIDNPKPYSASSTCPAPIEGEPLVGLRQLSSIGFVYFPCASNPWLCQELQLTAVEIKSKTFPFPDGAYQILLSIFEPGIFAIDTPRL